MKSLIVSILAIIFHLTETVQASSVSVSETLASSQVAPDGFIGFDGWVSQTTLNLNIEKVSLWYWNNIPLDNSLNEFDLGAMYFFDPSNTSFGKFTPFLRAEHWNWPEKKDWDNSITTGFNYAGIFNGHLRLTKLITNDLTTSKGIRLYGIISKEFAYKNTSFTPSVTGALLDDFYEVSGMSHITPGIEIGWALSKKISLSGFFNYQLSFKKYPDHGYGGIDISINL